MGELGQTGSQPRIGRLPTGDDDLDERLRHWDRAWLSGGSGEVSDWLSREITELRRDGDWEELDQFDAATGYQASRGYFRDLYEGRPTD